jgi:hypothetical protein
VLHLEIQYRSSRLPAGLAARSSSCSSVSAPLLLLLLLLLAAAPMPLLLGASRSKVRMAFSSNSRGAANIPQYYKGSEIQKRSDSRTLAALSISTKS